MKIDNKVGISAVKGFSVECVAAAVKYEGRNDVLLISSSVPAHAAGVFTLNKVKAESLLLCEETIKHNGTYSHIIINSGNANACTGKAGMAGAKAVVAAVAEEKGCNENEVLIASTGVIGEPFAADRIIAALPNLKDEGEIECAKAILTTDTYPKISSTTVSIDGIEVNIGGISKGSGMIAPNMGTMLGFICTDAKIETPLLKELVKDAVDHSFNRITVDGDTSTNDTVLLLANGEADVTIHTNSEGIKDFKEALHAVCIDLAKMIVKDGEGSTKLVNIIVKDAFSIGDALTIAKKIANSPLVKTAIHGEDPNWGRILGAAGNTEIPFQYEKSSLWIGDVQILQNGELIKGYNEDSTNKIMQQAEYDITLSCGSGFHTANIWTTDLSKEYISINADYRS